MLCYAQDLPGYTSQQKGKNYSKIPGGLSWLIQF